MSNRIIMSIALGLVFFQLLFSIYYSGKIVAYNQKFTQLEKTYQQAKYENQKLEIKFADQNSIHEIDTP